MQKERLKLQNLENLIEDLSDEELAICVGGVSFSQNDTVTGGSTVSGGESGNLATVDLVQNVKIPVNTSIKAGGTTTDIGLNNSGYFTCRQC